MTNKIVALRGGYMKLKIIKYDGTEMYYDALHFEFRTNQVANWIRMKFEDGKTIIVDDVCVIKTVE